MLGDERAVWVEAHRIGSSLRSTNHDANFYPPTESLVDEIVAYQWAKNLQEVNNLIFPHENKI